MSKPQSIQGNRYRPRTWYTEFWKSYFRFIQLNAASAVLSSADLSKIEEMLANAERKYDTYMLTLVTWAAVCTVVSLQLFVHAWRGHEVVIEHWIARSNNGDFELYYKRALHGILLVTACLFSLPLASIALTPKVHNPKIIWLLLADRARSRGYWGCIGGLAFCCLVVRASFGENHLQAHSIALLTLLLPLVASITAFSSLIVALASTHSVLASKERPFLPHRIAGKLIRARLMASGPDSSFLVSAQLRDQIANEIGRAAAEFRSIFGRLSSGLDAWTKTRVDTISSGLVGLGAWARFPQDNTQIELCKRLDAIIGAILTGRLHYLDELTSERLVLEAKPQSKWRSFLLHAFVSVYFLVPLCAFALATKRWGLGTSGLFQSIGGIFYLVWVATGFFIFSDALSYDSRTLLGDLLKSVISKKLS